MTTVFRCPLCRRPVPAAASLRPRCATCGCVAEPVNQIEECLAAAALDRQAPQKTLEQPPQPLAAAPTAAEPTDIPYSAETPATASPRARAVSLFDPPAPEPAGLGPAGESTATAQPVVAEPRSRGGNGHCDRSQHIPEFLRHAMQSAGPGAAWSYRPIGEREFWVNGNGDSLILCDRRRRRALVVDGDMSHSKLYSPRGLEQSTYRYPRPAKSRRVALMEVKS
jgi:hypothetical protein